MAERANPTTQPTAKKPSRVRPSRAHDRAGLNLENTQMFAVIKTGGKQFRVAANDEITIAKLEGNPGDTVAFGSVLMLTDGEKSTIGAPSLATSPSPARSSSRPAARRSSPSRSAAARIPSASAASAPS